MPPRTDGKPYNRRSRRTVTMGPRDRLARIRGIIYQVEQRCVAKSPVTPTKDEITTDELYRIFALSNNMPESWRPTYGVQQAD